MIARTPLAMPERALGTDAQESTTREFDLLEALLALWRRRVFIAAVALACAVAGTLGSAFRRPQFEGAATVLVSQSKIGEDRTPVPPQLESFVALLVNKGLVLDLIKEVDLHPEPQWRFTGTSSEGRLRGVDDFIANALWVEQVPAANLIHVRVRLGDAGLAAHVTNRLVERAIDFNREINQREVIEVRDYIKTQLDQTSERLKELEARLLDFKREGQIDVLRKDVEASLKKRADILGLRVDIENEKARLSQFEAGLERLPSRLTVRRSIDRDSATTEATRSTPSSVLGLQFSDEQVSEAHQILEEEVAKSRATLAGLEAQRRELVDVHGLSAPALSPVTRLYEREARLAALQIDYDLVAKSYADVSLRYEQARLQVASRSTQLQVIDRALVPETRVLPRITVNAVLSAAFGLALSLCVVLLRHYIDVARSTRA